VFTLTFLHTNVSPQLKLSAVMLKKLLFIIIHILDPCLSICVCVCVCVCMYMDGVSNFIKDYRYIML